jgi:hypothetical protein
MRVTIQRSAPNWTAFELGLVRDAVRIVPVLENEVKAGQADADWRLSRTSFAQCALAFPNQSENHSKGLLRPRPVLLNEVITGVLQRITENPGHQDDIIKLTCHRYEVRHQVKWHSKVKDHRAKQDLARQRHSSVCQQPLEEHQTIWDEASQRPGFLSLASRMSTATKIA